MTRMIDASEWASQMRKLTELIVEKRGKMKWSEAYRRFSHMKPRDFAELVTGVVESGLVMMRVDGVGSRYLEAALCGGSTAYKGERSSDSDWFLDLEAFLESSVYL